MGLEKLTSNVTLGTRSLTFGRKVQYWKIYSSLSKRDRTDSTFRQELGHVVPDPEDAFSLYLRRKN